MGGDLRAEMLKFGSKSDVTVVHRATIRLFDDNEIIYCDFQVRAPHRSAPLRSALLRVAPRISARARLLSLPPVRVSLFLSLSLSFACALSFASLGIERKKNPRAFQFIISVCMLRFFTLPASELARISEYLPKREREKFAQRARFRVQLRFWKISAECLLIIL